MKVFIVEDESAAARRLENLLKEIDPTIEIVGHCTSISNCVEWLQNNPSPDLIFMDIDLLDGQSFEIFNKVDVPSPVIFATAFEHYALKAFKVNSIDYLLKPIQIEEVRASIEKFKRNDSRSKNTPDLNSLLKILKEEKPHYKTRFLLKVGTKMTPITVDEIAYFRSEDKLSYIYSHKGGKFLADNTLDELEKVLDPARFFRANRQFLISIDSLENVHTYFNGKLKIDLKPKPADEVLVSREKATEFKQWLDQ
ncbi:MAG TPA: LytTR family DNA-binding domain-containing protein [Cytophagaceae bacterium]|jgi:DNA-binding LytR/AlgR family response regulator